MNIIRVTPLVPFVLTECMLLVVFNAKMWRKNKLIVPTQTTAIIRNVMHVILLITIVIVVLCLDIFEPKLVHVTYQKVQSHGDTQLNSRENIFRCTQKQNTIRDQIQNHCSELQVGIRNITNIAYCPESTLIL